jgi:hypothetical protein
MGAIGALPNVISDALAPYGVVAENQPFRPERLARWIGEGAGAPFERATSNRFVGRAVPAEDPAKYAGSSATYPTYPIYLRFC